MLNIGDTQKVLGCKYILCYNVRKNCSKGHSHTYERRDLSTAFCKMCASLKLFLGATRTIHYAYGSFVMPQPLVLCVQVLCC